MFSSELASSAEQPQTLSLKAVCPPVGQQGLGTRGRTSGASGCRQLAVGSASMLRAQERLPPFAISFDMQVPPLLTRGLPAWLWQQGRPLRPSAAVSKCSQACALEPGLRTWHCIAVQQPTRDHSINTQSPGQMQAGMQGSRRPCPLSRHTPAHTPAQQASTVPRAPDRHSLASTQQDLRRGQCGAKDCIFLPASCMLCCDVGVGFELESPRSPVLFVGLCLFPQALYTPNMKLNPSAPVFQPQGRPKSSPIEIASASASGEDHGLPDDPWALSATEVSHQSSWNAAIVRWAA